MQKVTEQVDEYLDSVPDEVRSDMKALDELIVKHMPKASRILWRGKFWGGSDQAIIGYGDMTFTNSKKEAVKWFMVGLALQKSYISVYNCATEDGTYVVKKYGADVGKVKVGSSSLSFKSLADINTEKLAELLDKAYAQLEL